MPSSVVPWRLGDQFSVADLFLFMLGREMPNPPRDLAPLADHAARVVERQAVQRAPIAEGLTTPFI